MTNETENVGRSQELTRKSSLVLVAYLAHLLVPLFLVLDVLVAWRLRNIEHRLWESAGIVFGISVLWLTVGLGALLLSRDRKQFLQRISKPLTSIYTIYFALIVFELFAQFGIAPLSPTPAVWPPGRKWLSRIDPSVYPGIRGVKAFTVNEVGLRGPALPRNHNVYKILAVGGSTTECAALDDTEEWPHLLMQEMSARQRMYPVWVANGGVSGHTTVHHLALLKTLPFVRNVDMIIFLIGVNDLGASLPSEGAPTQILLEEDAAAFRESILAGAESTYRYPLYKRLHLFRLTRRAAFRLSWKFRVSSKKELIDPAAGRKQRAAAPVAPLPDLEAGLKEYRVRVLKLALQCRAFGVRCLFLTQPSIWRSDLPPSEQQLLWWGRVGRWSKPKGYLSVADLARAMDAYNHELLKLCEQNRWECFDLASFVPKDTSAFYDDHHFNEQGARIVAHHLADYLLAKPPFKKVGKEASPPAETDGRNDPEHRPANWQTHLQP